MYRLHIKSTIFIQHWYTFFLTPITLNIVELSCIKMSTNALMDCCLTSGGKYFMHCQDEQILWYIFMFILHVMLYLRTFPSGYKLESIIKVNYF